jgi:hypothetical protein
VHIRVIHCEAVKMVLLRAVYMLICMKMENVFRREHTSPIAAHSRKGMLLVLLIVFDCDSNTKIILYLLVLCVQNDKFLSDAESDTCTTAL